MVEAGKSVGAGRGEGAVEADLLDKGRGTVGYRIREFAGVGLNKEGGQPFGDEGLGIGVKKKFAVLQGSFEMHDALAAGDKIGVRARSGVERGELPAELNNFLISRFGGGTGCKNELDIYLFLKARFK
jgi:hypothetical protein